MRLLRSDLVATLQEDFILMAKAKGISNARVLWRHALRPSSLTLLTVAGLSIGTLIGGALVVEYLLSDPGHGRRSSARPSSRQYVALQSSVALIAIFFVLLNFLIDYLYTVLDPAHPGALLMTTTHPTTASGLRCRGGRAKTARRGVACPSAPRRRARLRRVALRRLACPHDRVRRARRLPPAQRPQRRGRLGPQAVGVRSNRAGRSWAPTPTGATCSPGSSTGRGSRSSSRSAP
jgi:hypothetical protein